MTQSPSKPPLRITIWTQYEHRHAYPTIKKAKWSWHEIDMNYNDTVNAINQTEAGKDYVSRCEITGSNELRLVVCTNNENKHMVFCVAIIAYKNGVPTLLLEFYEGLKITINEYIKAVASFTHASINFDYIQQTVKLPASARLEVDYFHPDDPDLLVIIPRESPSVQT